MHILSFAALLTAFTATSQGATITGLTNGNRIVTFDSATPSAIFSDVAISGLGSGFSLIGLDYRPADGALIGVARNSSTGEAQVYTINSITGASTSIGSTFALGGTAFGVDFNPVANALRIVSDTEANLRIGVGGSGMVNVDTSLTRTPGQADASLAVGGAAYTNNFAGGVGGQTTLFVIDAATGTLFSQGSVNFPPGTSPNTGSLFSVGSLGLGSNLAGSIGFDISGGSLAFISVGNTLYSLNVNSGAATLIGTAGTSAGLIDIAVNPVPEPSGLILSSLGLLLTYRLRAKRAASERVRTDGKS